MNGNKPNSVKGPIVALTEKLLVSVNETARIARTSLLFFLVVALYLLIIVGTTTDLMLLRGEIVALPLMEVGVPVVTFYIVAPLIFLLLHSNLLLRLSQLAKTIKQWQANSNSKEQEDDHSSLVFPLDFALLLLYGKPRWALYAVVVTQIYILPIIVLLALQMSFLAYQSSGITFWHQLIVTTDLVLLFLFVCFVIGTREGRKVDCSYVLKMLFQRWGTVLSASLVLIFTWAIAVVPNSGQETMETVGMNADNFYPAVDGSQERSIQQQMSAWVFADWWKGYPITSYRPTRRFLNVAEQPITLKEAPPEIVGALIIKEVKLKDEEANLKVEEARLKVEEAKLKVEEAKLKGEETNLKVEEAKLKVEEVRFKVKEAKLKDAEANIDPLCEYIGELDLSGRQLNYARFYGSQFRCVKLESAELHGVDLSNAKLHGVDLVRAKLYGADLSGAKLNGADLFEAKLHGADLRWTKLHGADLRLAELYGAELFGTELHGAYLQWAELHGADLQWAELYGANLSKAKLHGADLSKAELHGADLGGAKLKNAKLSDVRWDKPKYWDNIISSIRDNLAVQGLADDEINERVLRIERISSIEFSFIPPTTPIATACVVHSGQGPFKEWPKPAEGCDIKFTSSLADHACQNQWTAKSFVDRVTSEVIMVDFTKASGIVKTATFQKEYINLITALLDKDCPVLNPYREELSDVLKELNQ